MAGLTVGESELVDAPAHWPRIDLSVRVVAKPPQDPDYVDSHSARLRMRSGGTVVIDRACERATFWMATPPLAGALVHPHLAGAAAVLSHWCGRDSFHAGAFVAGGGVWGLLGDKGAGKSSTLVSLARAGVPIVSDDVLVLDKATAYAGPRSIDLRTDAARTLGAGQPLGRVGDRFRWRVPLGPVEPELPFCGWVTLRWGPEIGVRPVKGADRIRELLRHRALRVPPPDPRALIELSALPLLELTRPRGWSSMEDTLGHLLGAVSN